MTAASGRRVQSGADNLVRDEIKDKAQSRRKKTSPVTALPTPLLAGLNATGLIKTDSPL